MVHLLDVHEDVELFMGVDMVVFGEDDEDEEDTEEVADDEEEEDLE